MDLVEILDRPEASVMGRSRSTFILRAGGGKVVAKRMTWDRDPERYLELLARLAGMPAPFCPRPLGSVVAEDGSCWYALCEWIEGEAPSGLPAGAAWRAALGLLERMRGCAGPPEWPLESLWLDRLREPLAGDPAARFLLDALRAGVPDGPRALAHGDFSLQNLVLGSGHAALVDWEEVGSAPPGFDAGWMLALARLGHGPRSHPEMLAAFAATGLPLPALRWFEALGLLRALYRARTLSLEDGLRRRVLAVAAAAVAARAADLGWHGDENTV